MAVTPETTQATCHIAERTLPLSNILIADLPQHAMGRAVTPLMTGGRGIRPNTRLEHGGMVQASLKGNMVEGVKEDGRWR